MNVRVTRDTLEMGGAVETSMNVQMEQTPTVVMATLHAPIIMAHTIVCVMKDILVMASHAKVKLSIFILGLTEFEEPVDFTVFLVICHF